MGKITVRVLLLLAALSIPGLVLAASGDDILGPWYNQERDARIEVYKCGDKYCGKVIWMKYPNYPEGSKDGEPGTPKLDFKNPNPELRNRTRLGLKVVWDMAYAGDNKWENGEVYDPNNGSTYSGKLTLIDPDNLNLRGYLGIPLFGRTSEWSRNPEPKSAEKR